MLEIMKNFGKGKSNLVNCSVASLLHKAGSTLDIHCDYTGYNTPPECQ